MLLLGTIVARVPLTLRRWLARERAAPEGSTAKRAHQPALTAVLGLWALDCKPVLPAVGPVLLDDSVAVVHPHAACVRLGAGPR